MHASEEGVPPLNAETLPEPQPEPEDNGETPTLGSIEEQEVLVAICAQLQSPQDLGRLACVSRAFGGPTQWAGGGSESRSVVEESARRWVLARTPGAGSTRSEGEQRGRSWLWRMHFIQARRFAQVRENSLPVDPVDAAPLAAVQVSAVEGQPHSVRLKFCLPDSSNADGSMRCIVGDEVLEPDGVHELHVKLIEGPIGGGQHFGVVKDGAPVLETLDRDRWWWSKDGWALMQNNANLFFRHNTHQQDTAPMTRVGESFTLAVDTALGELRARSDDGSVLVEYKMPDFDPDARYRFAVSFYSGVRRGRRVEAIVTR